MELVWREYLFSSTLLVSPGHSVKAAIWTGSPRKGSCIPESTGLGSKSGEGWPDVLDTEQPLSAGHGERLGRGQSSLA